MIWDGVLDGARDLCIFQKMSKDWLQGHPASYSMGTKGSFSEYKVAGAWCRPLISIQLSHMWVSWKVMPHCFHVQQFFQDARLTCAHTTSVCHKLSYVKHSVVIMVVVARMTNIWVTGFLPECVWCPVVWAASQLLYIRKYMISVMYLFHLQWLMCVCI